eukprot:1630624-Prymnesium_polylepis.1
MMSNRRIKCGECQASQARASADDAPRPRKHAGAQPAITMARILETSRPRSQHENLFPSPSKYLRYHSSVLSPPRLRYIAPVKSKSGREPLPLPFFIFGRGSTSTSTFSLKTPLAMPIHMPDASERLLWGS